MGNASAGIPAHLTLLYPFLDPNALDSDVRSALASVAGGHEAIGFELAGSAAWPDTVYVAVNPERPFTRLQADLAKAFPAFPIYGLPAPFAFVPHVTVAEGGAAADPATLEAPAWAALPRSRRADALEVIVRAGDGRWRTRWRVALAGSTRTGSAPGTRG